MNRITGRLSLLFFLFFLLILISAGATVWGLRAQSADALVINLAGRQRMLVQLMTRLASPPASHAVDKVALSEATRAFEETLHAFQTGGQANYPAGSRVNVPAAQEAPVRQQLARVEAAWGQFNTQLQIIQSSSTGSDQYAAAQAELTSLSPALVSEADELVRRYQDSAGQRLGILRWIQVGFFGSALLLMLAGGWVVRRSILSPLSELGQSAERIGQGDLDTPVQAKEPLEIERLSRAFEGMRARLHESRQELVEWNQSLEAHVQQRTRELDALYEVSREISSRLELNHVLQSVTAKARELLKADVAFLCLLDGAGQSLRLEAISGPADTVKKLSSPTANPFVRSILAGPAAHRCKASGCEGTCGILDDRFRTSHLAASLWVENQVIGALCVGSRQDDRFSEEAQQLLTRLASAAAVAIGNARLYAQAERLAALEERQRIAAAMHDGLAQMVDSLGLLIDQAAERLEEGAADQAEQILERAHERIHQASSEVRRSIASLQEEPLRMGSLPDRLRDLVAEFKSQGKPGVAWQVELCAGLMVQEQDTRQVLGIAQEALANAQRYSRASRIQVRLEYSAEEATLHIEDDGCGFDPLAPHTDGRRHFGLKILHARAAQLGGCITITSAPGKGTQILLTWPIRRALIHPDIVEPAAAVLSS